MQKISAIILRAEENIAAFLLCLIATLVFLSAVARTIGYPINWAGDASLLAFGWLTFLGSDVIIRHRHLIRIDMLEKKLPGGIRKALTLIFDIMMILFVLLLVVYGFKLVSQSWNRSFNTLSISYAWCTLAVPTGSVLMLQSLTEKFLGDIRGTDNRPVAGE
ncbi:MAG: TRAP transporter small permease [Succiniclasticum sp.]|jgi:TRAP-type C4-dicarboxylate transport system permease small subunit